MQSMEADRNIRAACDQVMVDLGAGGGSTTTATGLPQQCVSDLERLGVVFVAAVEEPVEQPVEQPVSETKEGPELHDRLSAMNVNPPRRAPVGHDDAVGRLRDLGGSDVDEAPPPPELSKSGLGFYTAMEGYFKGICAIANPQVAANKLAVYCDSTLDRIKNHVPASDKPELLSQLGMCLRNLRGPLQRTDEFQAALVKLESAEEEPSPAAVSFRAQTSKALKVFAACLDGSDAALNPNQFSARTANVLPTLVRRIEAHKPEGERYKMIVQLANDLCEIAQSPDAARHPHQRAELVKFLATVLGPASRTMGADEPHNQRLSEGLGRMLRPHQAEFPAREPAIAARHQVNNAIKAALAGDDRLDKGPAISKLIESLPMTAAEKNECFAELDLQFRKLIAQTPDRGSFRQLVAYHRIEVLKTMHEYVSASPAWPERAAYSALTDAVSEIYRDMDAREKARKK
ncbi:hypothetical protein BH11PSE7_BH11PSE7_04750 [soil metagenome]